MIVLVIIAGVCIYIGYKLKKLGDKYKHIPGISMLDFFRDAQDLPVRTAIYTDKFSKIVTPAVTFVLATHPDSAKVKTCIYLRTN